jgi:glycosyltransferase involved in cell wall biosynthesis
MPAAQGADPRPLRVTLDATPLLGVRTGIGRFVEHLVDGLAARPEQVALTATAFTARGQRALTGTLPPGVRRRGLPVPARALRAAWSRVDLPRAEWLTGRADIFHATNYVLPPLRRTAGVLSVHDLSFLVAPDTVHADSLAYRTLLPRGLRRAAVVCALTEATAAEISDRYGYPRDRIIRTPLGVDPSWFAASAPDEALRARLGLPDRYLVFVGTREPRKGLPTLLAAHRALRSDRPDAPPLVLVGAAGWGDQDHAGDGVLPLPYIDQQVLPRVVAGATALVMPSVYEGFGLPVLEGMAAGTPVVISDVPAMVEVAGGHASVFGVGDSEALAERLAQVLDGLGPDPVTARAFARGWTWDRCVDAVLDAYRLAIS